MDGKPTVSLLKWDAVALRAGHHADYSPIMGLAKKRAIKLTMDAAERATRWFWLKREAKWLNAAGMQAGD